MKTAVWVLIAGLHVSCGKHESQETTNPLDAVVSKGNFYYKNITDAIYKERCDKLTFKGLLSTYTVQNIGNLEVSPGKWVRDIPDCYPNESDSQVSTEGIISVIHHAISAKDCAMLRRLVTFGENNNWYMGEGATEDTDAHALSPFISSAKDRVCGIQLTETEANSEALDNVLSGYKGHILASFIWMRARINGSLNSLEKEALSKLVKAGPEDPLYQALKSRFDDGDQSVAISTLMNKDKFPTDPVPFDTGVFGWGSSPHMGYYLYVLAILQGK